MSARAGPTSTPARPAPRDAMSLPAAGHLARWCVLRPRTIITVWTIALLFSLVSIGQLSVSTSLSAMLGHGAKAAAATERITSDYQRADDLLVVVQFPVGSPPLTGDASDELIAFASRLERSLAEDPDARALVAAVRSGPDQAVARYVRDVITPRAAFFLTDEQFDAALRKLEPVAIKDQIVRNEAMMVAGGPAAGALGKAILRDPLRLFELLASGPASGISIDPPAADPSAAAPPPTAGELSADGRAILLRVSSFEPASNLEVARKLSQIVAKHIELAHPGQLIVQVGGPAAIASTAASMIRSDAIWATVISVGLLVVLFAVFYRRWSAALLVGGVASVGMIVGVGVLSLFLRDISPLGAMIAALLAGLGTDYGIHFLSHYEGARASGLSCVDAASQTARQMAIPIATNCLTSIFGFASLWPSQIKMLSDFAALGAAGLLGALGAIFVLLPAVLGAVDGRHSSARPATGVDRIGRVADAVARWPRSCIALCSFMLVVAVVSAGVRGFSLQIEPDLSVLHPRPNPALDATRLAMQRFAGRGEMVPIEIEARSFEELLVKSRDAARAIEAAQSSVPGLLRVAGLHQLVPDPQHVASRTPRLAAVDGPATLKAFDTALEASIFDPAAFAGYRRFLESLLLSRDPPTLAGILADADLAARFFPRSFASSTPRTVLLAMFDRPLSDRLARAAAVGGLNLALKDHPGVTVAGFAAVSEELDAAVRSDLIRSVLISVGLVLVWLLIVFRRPVDVALALLPLVFAAGATVLFMMATGQNFNPINSVAIPLLDGIAVDAGVFLVAASRAHGQTRSGLVRHLRLTTHAIILAAATTLTAFLALAMSHTPAIASLGMVASVGITAAFGAVLLLLMPILILRAPAGDSVTSPASLIH